MVAATATASRRAMSEVYLRDWDRLSRLLDELLDLDAPARAQRVAQLRAGDAVLATAIEKLLAHERSADDEGFLEGSALEMGEPSLAGRTLGAYRLERPLGAGGMGTVWLARRSDGRYEAMVAVKLLNLALLGRGGSARFRREGELLARLAHPHIARLLDAGLADGGQPYLVLEYVDGSPIDRWCDEHRLGIDARVRLALDVLDAVAHAHRKLVLHRDLKPTNILVTADGQVKLLDFGIAKLLGREGSTDAPTELTQAGSRAFTPDYAAPEQVQGGDVTTATDVYALGVLLYVLLAGVHPTARPRDAALERLRSVVETDPRPLSEAAGDDEAAAKGAATARGETPHRLARLLRGDLENICAKALKKAPEERYATVAALADDLRRWRADQPVIARPDSFAYRATKFVRRNRMGVGATAVVFATLVAGVITTTWQAAEAHRQRAAAVVQRDRAQVLLARNEAIASFVGLMFSEALPAGRAKVVQEMLENSESLIETEFADQPAEQAEVLRVLASYYTALSEPKKQYELLTRARRIVERVPDRSLQARLECDQGAAAAVVGRQDEGAKLLERWGAATDIEPEVAARCLQLRASLAQNAADPRGALRWAQSGLDRLRGAGMAGTRTEATLLGDIGFSQHLAGHNADADRSYSAALDRLRELGSTQGFDALRLMLDWGVVRNAMSDYRGALELYDRAIEITGRHGPSGVPPGALANRAFCLEQLGRYDQALAGYERTLGASRANGFVAGEAYALVGRASVLVSLGRADEAQQSLREADAPMLSLPAAHSARVRGAIVQARIDLARGDLAAAARGYGDVIERLRAQKATTPPLVTAYRGRAEVRLRQGDAAGALADAQAALDMARALQGTNAHSDQTGLAWLTLARAQRANGADDKSLQALGSAHAELKQTLGDDHPETRAAAELLAQR
jgi:serine/threonine-protein kinase